jgi:hypothetical protein
LFTTKEYKVKTQTESMMLTNEKGQILRIYKVENGKTFCIGIEGEDHFEFEARDAEEITKAIDLVVDSFS